MSFINRSSKEMYCKIIYAGPKGAGKTTNIQWIHKKISSENSEWMTMPAHAASTELFDFLPVHVGEIQGFSVRFHLYTMVKEELFQSTGKMLLKGLDGVVFVADSDPSRADRNVQYMDLFKTNYVH